MLNFLINFCLITFLCYAVAGPVRAILFPKKSRRAYRLARRSAAAVRQSRPAPRKKAKIIYLHGRDKKTARKNLHAA